MSMNQTNNRLSERAQAALRDAESFEVLALIPHRLPAGVGDPLPPARFYDYPVLGAAAVADRTRRDEIIASLVRGVEENALVTNCFVPRHGIRAVGPADGTDLVICFECGQLFVYFAGAGPDRKWLTISRSPKPALDRVLSDAGVPLEPDPAQREALRAAAEEMAEAERARETEQEARRAATRVLVPEIDPEKPRHSQFFQFVCPACNRAEEVGLWFAFKICSGCGKGWNLVRPPK
jgi:hypothetical protein